MGRSGRSVRLVRSAVADAGLALSTKRAHGTTWFG
jgi:hypothetical protein